MLYAAPASPFLADAPVGFPFPAAAPVTPPPASPFSLTSWQDDTALFRDSRAGFSHLLPGRPTAAAPRPGDPLADAVVHLQDAPITVRYRLESPSFAAPSALELARGTAERWASFRASTSVQADIANATWLASWGVDAAAVATYESGADHEDLFVLVRQGLVMLVTCTCPSGLTRDPIYASFSSVAEATMVWDAARWEQRGRVWPESAFAGPGLAPSPKPKYNEAAKRIVGAHVPPAERSALVAVLAGIASGAGAPWVRLAPDMLAANHRAVMGVARDAQVRAFVEQSFRDIRTAHDLRVFAVLLGRAL